MLKEGYVQVYTGNGKGKTTAALGLALRATGAGLKTLIIQFMKGQKYSELESLKLLKGHVEIEQHGSPKFCHVGDENVKEHKDLAHKALLRSREALADEKYDIVILDEIFTAQFFKLISLDDIIDLIKNKPANKELVLTGRGAPEEIYQHCDLITEMKEIKHYYTEGIKARKGIES